MFAILYSFQVKPGQEPQFETAWETLTRLFLEHANSLGSRLHKPLNGTYIAYAQWPDRQTWERSGERLPTEAEAVRQAMGQACHKISILEQLEVARDLLRQG